MAWLPNPGEPEILKEHNGMGCKFTRDVHNIRSHLRSFAISSNAIRLHPFPNDTAWGLCSLRCKLDCNFMTSWFPCGGLCSLRCKLDCNFMTSWFPCVCALVVLQGVLGGMVAGVLGALGFALQRALVIIQR